MSWTPEGLPTAEVTLDQLTPPVRAVGDVAADARASGHDAAASVLGVPGVFVVLAVPHPDSSVTTVVVAPRTRLIATDPFAPLLGLEDRETGEPPYSVALVERQPGDSSRDNRHALVSRRRTKCTAITSCARRRARCARTSRSSSARSAFCCSAARSRCMLDLVLLFALWMIAALPDGRVLNRLRVGVRRWGTSYRSRLTVVLFAFFVIPALVFALWSYERLRTEDRQSRDLVLREALRGISTDEEARRGASLVGHTDIPLLLYRDGELQRREPAAVRRARANGRVPAAVRVREPARGREVYASLMEQVAAGPRALRLSRVDERSGERVRDRRAGARHGGDARPAAARSRRARRVRHGAGRARGARR